MPTSRPRHQITETDEVARALDLAQRRWPGESRGQLAVRLIIEAGESSGAAREARRDRRRELLSQMARSYGSIYPEGHLDELRHDWPE